MSNLAIGFAGTFFTLWSSSYNQITKTYKYVYQKNISTDIDKVHEMYPGIDVDMTLKGHVCWRTEKNKTYYSYEPGVFPFGKNQGKRFNEVPISYLKWFYENFDCSGNEEKLNWWKESASDIIDILENNGIVARQFADNNRVTYDKNQFEHVGKTSYDTNIGHNEPIVLTMTSNNLDDEGMTRVANVVLKFNEITDQYFRGSRYFLPLLNGKAKRLKGKKIEVTDYEVIGTDISGSIIFNENTDYYGTPEYKEYDTLTTVLVKSWRIVK